MGRGGKDFKVKGGGEGEQDGGRKDAKEASSTPYQRDTLPSYGCYCTPPKPCGISDFLYPTIITERPADIK